MNRVGRCLVCTGALVALTAAGRAASADTTIDGGELGGMVWTADKGPYHVTGTAGPPTISAGAELRIERGTTVNFAATVGLAVAGKLVIEGSSAAPVVLQGEGGGTDVTWPGISTSQDTATIRIAGAVIRNATYGALVFKATEVHIDRTTIEWCNVGISVWRGTFAFDAVVLQNNLRGLEVEGSQPTPVAAVTLTNALIRGNRGHGAATVGTSPLTIINSTIDGNSSGATAWWSGGTATSPALVLDIQNTILTNNLRAIDLDTFSTEDSRIAVTVASSTFWKNGRNSQHKTKAGIVTVAATEVPLGPANAVADPLYASDSDQHLRPGSPCLDSGTAARAPDHDLEGNLRPQGTAIDRGAYESNPAMGAGDGGAGGGAGESGGAAGVAGGGGRSEGGQGGQREPVSTGGAAGGGDGSGGAGGGGLSGGGSGGAAAGTGTGNSGGLGPLGTGGRGTGAAGGEGASGWSSTSKRGDGCDCAVAGDVGGTTFAMASALLALMVWARRARR